MAAVAAGTLLPFAPAVLGLRTLSHRDTDRLYAPMRTLVVDALRHGRLPLWNPYEGTGKPLFAEGIHSVLHPVSLLGALLAPSSIDFLILAYLVAAALGAFALARSLSASPPASAGAALAFALSGFSVSMSGNLVFLAGLSSLPWLLAAARLAGLGHPWGVVLTALATATAFFSGDVQIALVGLALASLLAADAGGPRALARASAGFALGILLASVQILATYALLPLTYRGAELEPWERSVWALAPGRLLEWIVPGLLRGPLAEPPVGASGATLEPVFAESVYLGLPLLLAAGMGGGALLASARRRTGLLLASAALILLWFALGQRLGARQLFEWVPVWSRFRYSEKFMAPLGLSLAVLGAIGVDAFGAARLPRAFARGLLLVALAALTALATTVLEPACVRDLADRLFGDAAPFYTRNLRDGLPHLLLAAIALLAAARLRSPALRSTLLASVVAVAPAAAVYHGAHLGLPDARRATTALPLPPDAPVPRVAQPTEGLLPQQEFQDLVEAMARQGALLLYPATNVARAVDNVQAYGAFKSARLWDLAASFRQDWLRGFRRFGLTHLLLPFPNDFPDGGSLDAAVTGGAVIQRDLALGLEVWAVPHRPWAFFPLRSVAADGPASALGTLTDLVRLGDDATVVVEAPEAPPTSPGTVLAVARARADGAVRVVAESPGPGLLVVQDAFWPGWRAAIDGRATEILAADSLVRAVRWPAGRHALELVYDPPEVRIGLILSALGVLLLAAGANSARRKARPAPSREAPP
jgi:hypothetical protein